MYIRSQVKQAQTRFGHLANDKLGMVSIVLGATPNVNEIADIMAKARSDLRNLVNRRRKSDPDGWNDIEFLAWLETDCFDASQFGHLGTDKQRQIASFLTVFDGMTGPIWVPTIHGIVKLGKEQSLADLRQAFEKKFKFHRQVDICQFVHDFSTRNNIACIINYSNKHNDNVSLYGIDSGWDDSWIESYYGWLHQWSRGSLRIKISIKEKTIK